MKIFTNFATPTQKQIAFLKSINIQMKLKSITAYKYFNWK